MVSTRFYVAHLSFKVLTNHLLSIGVQKNSGNLEVIMKIESVFFLKLPDIFFRKVSKKPSKDTGSKT